MQGGGSEVRGPTTAEAGSTIQVEVQGSSTEIEVSLNGDSATTKLPVGPNGKVSIPIPPNATGRFLLVTTVGAPPPGTLTIQIISMD